MMDSEDTLTLSSTSPLANSPVHQEEEENEEVDGTLEELAAESGGEDYKSETLTSENQCNLCQRTYDQPRVLSCLHFFCESCLEKLLNESSGESHASPKPSSVLCPDCGQETKISNAKGVQGLPLDYVLCNQLEMSAIESMLIVCTSCKAKEKAVARCSDCANFLCPNCVTAHQFMRCFENHKVVTFEEMKLSKKNAEAAGDGGDSNNDNKIVAIHKPITCSTHPGEPMKYFCFTCQIPVCNECLVTEHTQPEHRYERAADAEPKQREELENLMAESRGKVDFCEEATSMLQTSLSDLEQQRDDARSLIKETFQSYKAVLEHRLEKLLEELEEIHSRQELRIMDTFQSVEKTIEKIDDACKFSERLLKHGNTIEVLSLKNLVGSQLLYLINNTPKPDLNVEIRFESDAVRFEEAVSKYFGALKQKSHNQQPPSTLSPTESNESTSVSMFGMLNNTNSSSGHHINGNHSNNGHHNYNHHQGAASPLHSTSSFDSDHFALPVGVLSPDSGSVPSLDMDLTNNVVAQYNLTQLANMAAESGNGSHDVNDAANSIVGGRATPGSPQMHAGSTATNLSHPLILSDLLTCTDDMTAQINAFNNLSVLANMGSVSLSGLTGLDSVVGQQSSQSRNSTGQPIVSTLRSIQQSPTDSGLGALLNGGNGSRGENSSSGMTSTPQRICSPGLDSPILNGVNLNLGISRGVTPTSGQSSSCSYNPPPRNASNKLNTMQIRCKFGQLGPGKSQFSSPHGFCLGLEEEIIVADTNNHRIQVFDKVGEFKLQFGVPGKEEGQLWYPRKVAVIRKTGKFVICDRGNERSRMQIFTKTGHFIKKIAIRYIDIVAGLAITNDGHIVAVDSVSPTVFVIAETGDLLHWFDCSEYMREPSDIAISNKEYYICDFKGHCVIVFSEEGNFLRRIGCENITNFPNGIDISDAGDVLVGDSHGNRFHVVVFSREGSILSEFECPYVKVSRCCGLKITSEGYIVTLAKNNHHVLILNTLYIM